MSHPQNQLTLCGDGWMKCGEYMRRHTLRHSLPGYLSLPTPEVPEYCEPFHFGNVS